MRTSLRVEPLRRTMSRRQGLSAGGGLPPPDHRASDHNEGCWAGPLQPTAPTKIGGGSDQQNKLGKKQHFPWEQELTGDDRIPPPPPPFRRGPDPPPRVLIPIHGGSLPGRGGAHSHREGAGCRAPRRASVWRSRVWKSSRITHPTVAAAPGRPGDEGSEMKLNKVHYMSMFGN